MIKNAIRTLVRHYCQFVPIAFGKTQLMFHCKDIVTPYTANITLPCGYLFKIDLSDNLQRQIYFKGIYEPNVTKLLEQTLNRGDIFIDIGANIGYFSVIASHIIGPTGEVHSFEPIPEIFESLKYNVTINSISNIYLNQTAIHKIETSLPLYLPADGNNGSGSLIRHPHLPGQSIMCPAKPLDDYISATGLKSVNLIKIDIEGNELNALKGMERLLSSHQPPKIICEGIPELIVGSGQTLNQLFEYLESLDYFGTSIDCPNILFSNETEPNH